MFDTKVDEKSKEVNFLYSDVAELLDRIHTLDIEYNWGSIYLNIIDTLSILDYICHSIFWNIIDTLQK